MTPQTFTIQAGTFAPGNAEILVFAPQSLQIHRGDTVTWLINGFHDVRFDSAPAELVVVVDVNGAPTPTINPVVAFPSIENGAVYQGGSVGSGLPLPPASPVFSLVMDVEPGNLFLRL
jgi:hypothetical protein